MRAFILLCVLAAVQADKLGYNYQPVAHSSAGLSFAPSGAAPSYAAPSYAAPSYSAPSYNVPAASSNAPSYSAPAGIDKEYYSFSANDEEFLQPAASEQVSSLAKQHLQVIFVKGPEHTGLEDAAVALAKQASERKTAIYILNKQADLSDLANKLNNVGAHSNSKPEVHFVKYRTPQDAENAQRQIQSQYDALGGSSQSHFGGVAPSINFASNPVASQQQAAASAPAPQSNYLPASIIKRFRL